MSRNENIAVIYYSKSGFTKTYATWIAKELNCVLLERSKTGIKDLMVYDTIIYGGGLYAGGIGGLKLITKNIKQLKDKKLVLFAVGASPSREETTKELLMRNLSPDLRSLADFYYLRGGFNFNRLNWFYKIVMSLYKFILNRIKDKSADTKGMLASYKHPVDFTNIKNIQPIINNIQIGG